ncbi:MAG: 50S ribosomal protein L22 [Bacteroidales bacterium]|nr:50S ribosomal protein L22 [Bacteroidales bacterium]
MGKRKRLSAEKRKEQRSTQNYAVLRNSPVSARKMRLVADLVRGKDVETALNMLTYTHKDAALRLKKLLLSAIANWEQKNENSELSVSNLYIKSVAVDGGRTLKRISPRAQGRAFRVRKRSNHVTINLDTKTEEQQN